MSGPGCYDPPADFAPASFRRHAAFELEDDDEVWVIQAPAGTSARDLRGCRFTVADDDDAVGVVVDEFKTARGKKYRMVEDGKGAAETLSIVRVARDGSNVLETARAVTRRVTLMRKVRGAACSGGRREGDDDDDDDEGDEARGGGGGEEKRAAREPKTPKEKKRKRDKDDRKSSKKSKSSKKDKD